jgi:tocopherol O-methyltransferase
MKSACILELKRSTDGMLLPPLCTQKEYLELAKKAGLAVFSEPKDISQEVRKTWYECLYSDITHH